MTSSYMNTAYSALTALNSIIGLFSSMAVNFPDLRDFSAQLPLGLFRVVYARRHRQVRFPCRQILHGIQLHPCNDWQSNSCGFISILQRYKWPLSEVYQHLPRDLDDFRVLRRLKSMADHQECKRPSSIPLRIFDVHGRYLRNHVLTILPDPEQEAQHPRALSRPWHLPILEDWCQLESLCLILHRGRSVAARVQQKYQQQPRRRRNLEDLYIFMPIRLCRLWLDVLSHLSIRVGCRSCKDR